jgi:predicted nucleic acid-binding protein
MDTNVFISKIKPDDPYHLEADLLINKIRKGQIKAETSVLTLLELSSVAGRLYHRTYDKQENIPERRAFVVKMLKTFANLGVKFVHMAGDLPFTFGNIKTDVPSMINESIFLSIQIPLRTLDLFHVAAARHAKQNNHDLGAFVTGDKEILLMKDDLSRFTGLAFLSPREYVNGLGLK